ncbi:dihydrolipoyl dehydrogenase [Thiospirochaeta perfilievii]|uniref:Dihydrolipoyl dehydrogenase n=1 Tax=Thiospirochaeta perfilievii TaxID=252967 RepID=A0A5C1Q6A4_9SPIO|nr:dihydrolipoyl dehydrogenase [Thiospirochaeta perfilievii]QEN03505.1 dihydrolipoyl dehydrogenase [Thiospirochaeta perfilievii]
MYDLIVIGGGPAGYTGALEAANLDKKVLLIEKSKLGGTCLNSGCIPTKSLLHSSKLFKKISNLNDLGVVSRETIFDLSKAIEWKDLKVSQLQQGLSALIKSKKIDVEYGDARLLGNKVVEVDGKKLKGENILIAAGSKSLIPNIKGSNNHLCLTSRSILNLKEIPNNLVIIGAGVIGLEFASIFSSIGSNVTVLEYNNQLLPSIEKRVSSIFLKAIDFTIKLGVTVSEITNNSVIFKWQNNQESLAADKVLIATGRIPNSKEYESIGVVESGRIKVDEYMRTNLDGVFAAGDVTGKTFLAHGGIKMAEIAVNNMFNPLSKMNYDLIPSIIYSEPEIATVGITLREAKERGKDILKSNYYLNNNGRYLVENGFKDGLCIVIADKESRIILGAHIIGTDVSEIISNFVIAVKQELTIDQLKQIIFPHPTMSEIFSDTIKFL